MGNPFSKRFALSRYTIRDPEEADRPRSRKELNAYQALGAILNKPQWWVKWGTRPEVRKKWLREISQQLVRLNVSQTVKCWPSLRFGESTIISAFLEIAHAPAKDKERRILQVLEHVQYPHSQDETGSFSMGVAYESDDEPADVTRAEEGFDDNYNTMEVQTNFREVSQRHKRSLNSFCEIGWYVTMEIAREKLRNLPIAQWTEANVTNILRFQDGKANEISRTTELILSVVFSGNQLLIDVVHIHLPNERRQCVLKLLLMHFQLVADFLDATKKNIETVLDLILERAHLNDGKMSQHNTPGTVPKTWLSDDAIPYELKRKFLAEIASLENVPDDQKDWHPNSDHQVLDLVHPSLFCGLMNRSHQGRGRNDARSTSIVRPTPLSGTAAEHMKSIMFTTTTDILKGPRGTRFQWLPSEFDAADDGNSVNIRTYINNLHPEIHASMYDSIGSISRALFHCLTKWFLRLTILLFKNWFPLSSSGVSVIEGIRIHYTQPSRKSMTACAEN